MKDVMWKVLSNKPNTILPYTQVKSVTMFQVAKQASLLHDEAEELDPLDAFMKATNDTRRQQNLQVGGQLAQDIYFTSIYAYFSIFNVLSKLNKHFINYILRPSFFWN